MLEKLNTPGGHILVYFGLICTGISMYLGHIPHAEDVTFGSFTALLGMLAPQALANLAQGPRAKQPEPGPETTGSGTAYGRAADKALNS